MLGYDRRQTGARAAPSAEPGLMKRHVRSDAPDGRAAGRDSQARLWTQSAAILRLHRSVGNRAVTRLLLRDPQDDFTTAARIVAALGGGPATTIRAELERSASADHSTGKDYLIAAEYVRDLVKHPWAEQKDLLRMLDDYDLGVLERISDVAYRLRTGPHARLYSWTRLERARRSGDWDALIEDLARRDDEAAVAFLRTLTADQLDEIDFRMDSHAPPTGLSIERVTHLRGLFSRALALRIRDEPEESALRDLRYLSSKDFEAVEDEGAKLGGHGANVVRQRIRTVRDSVSVDDIQRRVDQHLLFVSLAITEGVAVADLEKSSPRDTTGFWVGLIGNLAWAVAGIVKTATPAGRFSAVITQIGGAIAGSGTYGEIEQRMAHASHDPAPEFRLRAAEALASPFLGMRGNQTLLRSVTDELWNRHQVDRNVLSQPEARDDIVWRIMFPGLERDQTKIARITREMIESLWSAYWPAISGKLADEMEGRDKFPYAIVRSGVADQLGYGKASHKGGANDRWELPDGTVVTPSTWATSGYEFHHPSSRG
jgi:hypothetical protein